MGHSGEMPYVYKDLGKHRKIGRRTVTEMSAAFPREIVALLTPKDQELVRMNETGERLFWKWCSHGTERINRSGV